MKNLKLKRKLIKILLIGFLVFMILPFLPLKITKAISTDDYPYKSYLPFPCDDTTDSNCADPWNFDKRQCTSYVAWRANQSGVPFSNGMTGPNGTSGLFRSASNWDDNASRIGFTVDHTPSVGAIAVWEPGVGGADNSGHVAWVEVLNSNGTIDVSEYNWNYGDGKWNYRNVIATKLPSEYIHLGNSCGIDNVNLQNKVVSSNSTFNCNAHLGITVKPESSFQSGSNVRLYIN